MVAVAALGVRRSGAECAHHRRSAALLAGPARARLVVLLAQFDADLLGVELG